MPKIKLREWANRNNLSYITANRHFHAGLIPDATQLDSGTILIEDDFLEKNMTVNAGTNDAMSLFLKKTVEFSKNNSSVEDFAAYVISNFQLKLNGQIDIPRYSKNKPKPEEVQKHFKQFIPDKEKEEELKNIKTLLKQQTSKNNLPVNEELQSLFINSKMNDELEENVCDSQTIAEDLITQNVDLNTTPQQINYTGSTNQIFSNSNSGLLNSSIAVDSMFVPIDSFWNNQELNFSTSSISTGSPFQPTKKELLSSVKVIETNDLPRKRGRKPIIKRDK